MEANDFKAQIDKYKLKNEGNAETKKEIANMMTKVSDDISSMPFEQTFEPPPCEPGVQGLGARLTSAAEGNLLQASRARQSAATIRDLDTVRLCVFVNAGSEHGTELVRDAPLRPQLEMHWTIDCHYQRICWCVPG